MASIKQASTYQFEAEETLILDANVLLFVSGVTKDAKKAQVYARVLENIKSAQCLVIVEALIVSEFANRYAKLRTGEMGVSNRDFKRFRNSKAFKLIAREIAKEVKEILRIAKIVPTEFNVKNAVAIIDDYAEGESDFNDLAIIETGKKHSATIVTDDGDFRDKGISVLTQNYNLLNDNVSNANRKRK